MDILDLETVKHNEHYMQTWCFDSNDKNARAFFMLSFQQEKNNVIVYNVEIGKEFILERLKEVIKQLEKK